MSDRNDVFNFQKPGPLGLAFVVISMVTIEWSVLYPGTMSTVLTLFIRLWLIKRKSSLH